MNLSSLRKKAGQLKLHVLTIYFASRDPGMPLAVKCLALLVTAYALSPIDLIPDFIPVIGFLDDLILIPLGLSLVIRFTPPQVMESAQIKAKKCNEKPVSYTAALVIIVIWLIVLFVTANWLIGWLNT